MDNVIYLDKFRARVAKQDCRDLNDESDLDRRIERIQGSIQKINKLMAQLRELEDKK